MGIESFLSAARPCGLRDWCAEQTNFPREVAEAALGHIVGDSTERAYRRGDVLEKRRRLMEAWAAYCQKAASGGGHSAAESSLIGFGVFLPKGLERPFLFESSLTMF